MRNQKTTVPQQPVTTTTATNGAQQPFMTHIEAALALSDLPAPAAQAVYANDIAAPATSEETHVPIIVRLIPDERDPSGPRSIVWSQARFEMATSRANGEAIARGSYAAIMALAHQWQATHAGLLWRPIRRSDLAGVPTDGKAV